MALLVPRSTSAYFTVDNWGTNPSATPGTSVTPGGSGAEGTYTTLIAAGSVTEDLYGFYVRLSDMSSTTGVANNTFVDIGLDRAGGTSFTDYVANIVCGGVGPITAVNGREMFFPLFVPSGSTIGARARRVSATAGTMRVALRGYGRRGWPEHMPVGSGCQTLGVSETTAVDATAVTPGNAADGTWTSIGTLATAAWWHQVGYQIDNTAVTAEYTYIDLGYGDGTNMTIISRIMHGGNTTEQVGAVFESIHPYSAYAPVAAGETMYVRMRCNNAPDTGYQAAVYSVG